MSFLSKSLLGQTLQTIGVLMLVMLVGLFLDSEFVAKSYYEHAQWINNVLVVILFIFLYLKSPRRTREQLIYAFLIAIVGEYVFSKFLGMYTYRLENIPHYIPPGHAVVFLLVYNFCKKSEVRKHSHSIEKVLTIVIAILAISFLVVKNDIYGFLLTVLVFYFLRKHPKEKLFYLTMYVFVVYTEIIGTAFNCWEWPPIAFDKFSFLPSANPPIGISFFYFGLDRGTMSIYKRRHKKEWNRLKQIRAISLKV